MSIYCYSCLYSSFFCLFLGLFLMITNEVQLAFFSKSVMLSVNRTILSNLRCVRLILSTLTPIFPHFEPREEFWGYRIYLSYNSFNCHIFSYLYRWSIRSLFFRYVQQSRMLFRSLRMSLFQLISLSLVGDREYYTLVDSCKICLLFFKQYNNYCFITVQNFYVFSYCFCWFWNQVKDNMYPPEWICEIH